MWYQKMFICRLFWLCHFLVLCLCMYKFDDFFSFILLEIDIRTSVLFVLFNTFRVLSLVFSLFMIIEFVINFLSDYLACLSLTCSAPFSMAFVSALVAIYLAAFPVSWRQPCLRLVLKYQKYLHHFESFRYCASWCPHCNIYHDHFCLW